MFALAYCARQNRVMELRTLAYEEAATLIDNQADFLMFMKYCVKMKAALNENDAGRKGFGKAMRKLVKTWYGKYTNVELADMFGEHRGLYKWTHRDVFALAHLNPKIRHSSNEAAASVAVTEPEPQPTASGTVPVAVAGAAAAALVGDVAGAVSSDVAGAVADAAADEIPRVGTVDRENVLQFNFKNGQRYLKYLSDLDLPLGEGALRMKALQHYKTNESSPDAVDQIRANGFKLSQTPAALLERIEIWDALLSSLTYRELLEKLFTLKDLGFLNQDRRFAKKYVKELKNTTKCDAENPRICPIHVFITKRLYEKNERYLAKTKKMHYAKKMEKRGIQINETVSNQLKVLFEHTLANGKRAPANYFIALDLRAGNASSEYSYI